MSEQSPTPPDPFPHLTKEQAVHLSLQNTRRHNPYQICK